MKKNKNAQLELIKKDILEKLKCPLKEQATNLVFGKGNTNAKIFFIGEAPGAKEDEAGIPFIGRAGKDLDKALNKINLNIDDVYIANILKYRPPKNRDPSKDEIISHTPYLIRQIETINPKIIVTLGNFSTKFILSKFNQKEMKKVPGISQIHGQEIQTQINNKNYIVVPIYHPSAMIYKPKLREEFEKDFINLKNIINNEK